MAAVRASGGTRAGCTQRPNRLHDPIATLCRRGGRTGQHGTGGRLGLNRVGFAPLPTHAPVGPVDLDHDHLLVQQVAGQAGTVAAGALHPDRVEPSMPAQPAE